MTPKKNKMATILTTVKAGLVCKVFVNSPCYHSKPLSFAISLHVYSAGLPPWGIALIVGGLLVPFIILFCYFRNKKGECLHTLKILNCGSY